MKTEKKRYKIKEFSTFFLALPVLFCLLFCNGCGKSFQKTVTTFACDTVVTITYYDKKDEKAVNDALSYLSELELVFSRTKENSELYALNEALHKGEDFVVGKDLYQALVMSYEAAKESDGAFDFTLGNVSDLWNFTGETPHVPDAAVLAEALSHTGYEKIHLEGIFVTDAEESNPGGIVSSEDASLSVDLGGMAKGYMGQKLKEQLMEAGVTSALLNLGGNVVAIGKKPDGTKFQIGIAKPEKDSSEYVSTVGIANEAAVTSGIYQRYFEENGKWYHHILDPKTGVPVESDVASVTVIYRDSGMADILSTTMFVTGPDYAETYVKNCPQDITVIYVMKDGSLKEFSNK